jgi:hypothetical protein
MKFAPQCQYFGELYRSSVKLKNAFLIEIECITTFLWIFHVQRKDELEKDLKCFSNAFYVFISDSLFRYYHDVRRLVDWSYYCNMKCIDVCGGLSGYSFLQQIFFATLVTEWHWWNAMAGKKVVHKLIV